MKEHVNSKFGGIGIGSDHLNIAWNKIKRNNILVVPLSEISLPQFLLDCIELETLAKPEAFGWYSFLDNYRWSNDKHLYDEKKYDILSVELDRCNLDVVVLYEECHGFHGTFCSWNRNILAGFIEYQDNYGYYIKYK